MTMRAIGEALAIASFACAVPAGVGIWLRRELLFILSLAAGCILALVGATVL